MNFLKCFILLTFILFIGCQKDDLGGKNNKNYFNLTLEDGRKFSAKYITGSTSLDNNIFRSYNIDSNRISFAIIFENNTQASAGLALLPSIDGKIIINKTYENDLQKYVNVFYAVRVNYTDLCQSQKIECKKEILFTSYNHPGRIAGMFKLYDSTGTKIVATSEFDFISQ